MPSLSKKHFGIRLGIGDMVENLYTCPNCSGEAREMSVLQTDSLALKRASPPPPASGIRKVIFNSITYSPCEYDFLGNLKSKWVPTRCTKERLG